jgi:hypothetical protein
MASDETSIHIKLGHLEVDYKGDPSFLNGPLLKLCKELLVLQKENPAVVVPPKATVREVRNRTAGVFEHSTDTIATLLGPTSGPNLVLAAAAHLHFVKGEKRFSRKNISDEMKTAIGHYKDTFFANLTGTLKRLALDGKLHYGSNMYTLSNTEAQALEAKLAQA